MPCKSLAVTFLIKILQCLPAARGKSVLDTVCEALDLGAQPSSLASLGSASGLLLARR